MDRVLLIVDGQRVLDMTWQQCLELGRALMFQARKAEELTKVDQVVMDQAILMRAGFPMRMATNHDMLKLAGNEAAWNSDLRRYMPDNIEQYGTLYPPTVINQNKLLPTG
jgi:hypothetical protein